MKKYIKEEIINVIGKEVTYRYFVTEDNVGNILQANDVNEIIAYVRDRWDTVVYSRDSVNDARDMGNNELLMLLLIDTKYIDYKKVFFHHFNKDDDYLCNADSY